MGKHKRHFYVNERVKAMFTMALIMAVAIVVVFIGMEALRHLPYLNAQQQMFLSRLRYPFFLKIMVMLDWGFIAILSAYLVLEFQYKGFFIRFNNFLQEIIEKQEPKKFPFRNNDTPSVMDESFNNLLKKYAEELDENQQRLLSIKDKLTKKVS